MAPPAQKNLQTGRQRQSKARPARLVAGAIANHDKCNRDVGYAENDRIAVIVPCLNEEATIGRVLTDFAATLPGAQLVVVDNNCTGIATRPSHPHEHRRPRASRETRPGKGHAMRKAFREIDADVYVMVDGDDTYPARDVLQMLPPIQQGAADVVIGARLGAKKVAAISTGSTASATTFCCGR